MTVLERIGAFVAVGCPLDDTLARTRAIEAVADFFGCMLAGAESEVAERLWTSLNEVGVGDAPVFGTGRTLSPPFAAMANAVAGHAYDFDDCEDPGNTHPSAVMVPALLAAAAMRPASGEEMLSAYATGFEVIARLGEALTLDHYVRGFHSTATLAAIGAAAAVSRLRGLNADAITRAMALSVSQAVGYTCQFGSDAKPLQAGLAAKAGLLSALMAEGGMTGQAHVLEGPNGMNALMAAGSDGTFAAALAKLGDPPALVEYGLLLKPYPSCSYTHRLISCATDIASRDVFETTQVTRIRAGMLDFHKAILPFSRPRNHTEALFSIEFCIAQALAGKHLSLSGLKSALWEEPDIARLAALVEVTEEAPQNPALNCDPDQPDWLEVHCGKRIFRAQCAYPLGAPLNPMTHDQRATKFKDITGRNQTEFEAVLAWASSADVAAHFLAIGGQDD